MRQLNQVAGTSNDISVKNITVGMKSAYKTIAVLGIIALAMFSLVACNNPNGGNGNASEVTQGIAATASSTDDNIVMANPDSSVIIIKGEEYQVDLTELDLRGKELTDSDIAPLEKMLNLKSLNLNDNRISDISALQKITSLSYLYMRGNQISDISALSGLSNLKELNLSDNQITDISPLDGLANLTALDMTSNQISDISALDGLVNLKVLNLGLNLISDIAALDGLTNLQVLDITSNQITDISSLSGHDNLGELYLSVNQITDISALSGLTNLIELYFLNNQVTDISALSGLANLVVLELSNNQVSDISPLEGLTNLSRVNYDNNPIKETEANGENGASDSYEGTYVLYIDSNEYGATVKMTDVITLKDGYAVRKQSGTSKAGGHTVTLPEAIDDLGEYSVVDNKLILHGLEMGIFENGTLTYMGQVFTKQ